MLVFIHIFLITLSNILVQYPFTVFHLTTTFGAISYPFIFIVSDYTVRRYGRDEARRIIFKATLPALVISYLCSHHLLKSFPESVYVRIALASLSSYLLGQLLDIYLFQYFRERQKWTVSILISSTCANIFDTFCFFFIAFYQGAHPFFSQHWLEVAWVDLYFKMAISIVAYLPIYGLINWRLQKQLAN